MQESCFDVLMHVKIFLIDDPENFHNREPLEHIFDSLICGYLF